MPQRIDRRGLLQSAAVLGTSWTAGGLGWLAQLPLVSRASAADEPARRLVTLDSGIAPLVELVERTSRGDLLGVLAQKIRGGTTYQELLAALQLAAVRNVQPRPAVGFKFHAVLVVHAAHLASLASPDAERWLPLFWAFDYFKGRQAEEEQASGWKLGPPDEGKIPPANQAKRALTMALDQWDEGAADGAAAALARSASQNEIFELLYRYGARDYRSIGHKAIYVANCQRTLAAIGPQHTEPILRSLVFALLNHQGEPNPASNDLAPDRPWRLSQELAPTLANVAATRAASPDETRELIAALREESAEGIAREVARRLQAGAHRQTIWDAVFLASGELLMRQPGIIGLHTLTAANALRYAYDTSGDDQTRLLMLFQACAFLPLFRQSAQGRGALRDLSIEKLEPQEPAGGGAPESLEEIFADVSADRAKAAAKTLGFLRRGGSAVEFTHAARRLVFLKGNDAHDYKFSGAVLEDAAKISPAWRDTFLALSVFNLSGSQAPDSQLVQRARDLK